LFPKIEKGLANAKPFNFDFFLKSL